MWKHAFELNAKAMEMINDLDASYQLKLNDKNMQRSSINVKTISMEKKIGGSDDEEEDVDEDEENLAPWQKEYKKEMKEEVARKARELRREKELGEDKGGEIVRNVDSGANSTTNQPNVSEQSLVTTECEIFMDNLYIFLGK